MSPSTATDAYKACRGCSRWVMQTLLNVVQLRNIDAGFVLPGLMEALHCILVPACLPADAGKSHVNCLLAAEPLPNAHSPAAARLVPFNLEMPLLLLKRSSLAAFHRFISAAGSLTVIIRSSRSQHINGKVPIQLDLSLDARLCCGFC